MSTAWEWLTEDELSERTGISVETLRSHRHKKVGCPFHDVPKTRIVMYHIDDVNEWLRSGGKQETRAA